MEEVLGEEGIHSVLNAAQVLAEARGMPSISHLQDTDWVGPDTKVLSLPLISRILEAFEQVYGSQAGQGLALRVGRACFQYSLREYGQALGLTGISFRLLPLPSKLRTLAGALTGLFNKPMDERIRVEEQEGKLLLHLIHCPLCWERRSNEKICHMAVGLAEESLYWLSGGKIFQVEEIACTARGNPYCSLQIDAAPIS
jgi:predicted hydrocarbon binding protein